MSTLNVVVMGVAGSGKSTVGEGLARALDRPFLEGDAYHPEANVAKMRAGVPLTDDDRWPWLDVLAGLLADAEAPGVVLSCSALRRVYRDRLRARSASTFFIHVDGPRQVLAARLSARRDHFMPTALLDSQLATLEPLQPDEAGAVLDLRLDIAALVEQACAALPG